MSRSCRSVLRVAECSSRSVFNCAINLETDNRIRAARYAPRSISLSSRQFSSSRTALEAQTAQPPKSAASPKIQPIVDSISSLSLLEVSELVSALKERLNISEIAMPSSAAAPAAAPAASAEPAEEKPKEKTMFIVKLEKFDAGAKAKIIREIKAIMPNMNLVEAKKFVESVPQTIKENVPKEDAEKLQKTLTDLGATVSLS
ncbi:ribosomal protein L7/L12 C-terminal domain-domain-containing protein [Naematelia encephala]|uniref:Ribosomal protein L7/L12 C-terminal domain-domain-containing protein n=1 Tax=Naematelia encephala TaxID=71784 RepID=A0A1Y2BF29_9TREE|nr:ribosomal protein L7/L12 C-terminal domain-domain-containing protein [Naematelia encephala]